MWSDQERRESLELLFERLEERAIEAVAWYMRRKRLRALLSQGLRLCALTFASLGGLIPLIAAVRITPITLPPETGQLGYVAFAMAAGSVAIDRFFGLSTAWMRYMISALAIQRALADLQLDWAMMQARLGSRAPNAKESDAMLLRLKRFQDTMMQIIEQETQGWVAEFQTNLSELARLAKNAPEPTRSVEPIHDVRATEEGAD